MEFDFGVGHTWICSLAVPPAAFVTTTKSLTALALLRKEEATLPGRGDISQALSMPSLEKILHKCWSLCLPSWWPDSMQLDLVSSWLLAYDFLQDTVLGLLPNDSL